MISMAKILVIDDEPTIVMVLEEILQDAGYEVFTASNGLHGLNSLRKGLRPDLLIIDLLMPVMGGREFLSFVHKDFKLSAMRVILLTGSIPNEKEFPPEEFYQDIICKPFNIDDVVTSVGRFLGDPGNKCSGSLS
jgi:CheY-like chemotaxis protein